MKKLLSNFRFVLLGIVSPLAICLTMFTSTASAWSDGGAYWACPGQYLVRSKALASGTGTMNFYGCSDSTFFVAANHNKARWIYVQINRSGVYPNQYSNTSYGYSVQTPRMTLLGGSCITVGATDGVWTQTYVCR